ncbi:hypothetical protein SISNIDRAFT_429652 [Sistotremastrum niveocremeum HHB9708]|uniref:very-long-chain enoyl-CoA reductase n=1 Tax=Sistotremastrum niveocremeum HHB9708 TaxID=1314777 RepID=A0A164T139_9AGAM|nr:hypothetical protein SISNIDRAFT_429652 [Sistotremastrum niveocremeum HHB9708]
MVSITLLPSSKSKKSASKPKAPIVLSFSKPASEIKIQDVKLALQAKKKLHPTRQKISKDDSGKALEDDQSLSELKIGDDGKLYYKDLGPQIGWRTVFLIEYGGPLIIHPLIYHLSTASWAWGSYEYSRLQTLVYYLVLGHFVKREFETVFVHRFSHATMPFTNVFKNSAHYWLLSGVLLALSIYRPAYSAEALQGTLRDNTLFLGAIGVSFVLAELSNLQTHLILRSLRPANTTTRAIPRGFLFELVSCPNYLTEILAWGAIWAGTFSYSALLFLVVSTTQMALWAIKKHKSYKREFGDKYPRGRKVLVPFIF